MFFQFSVISKNVLSVQSIWAFKGLEWNGWPLWYPGLRLSKINSFHVTNPLADVVERLRWNQSGFPLHLCELQYKSNFSTSISCRSTTKGTHCSACHQDALHIIEQYSAKRLVLPKLHRLKKNGNLRFCVDYRKFIFLITLPRYLILRIDDWIDCLGDSNSCFALSANLGYCQMPISKRGLWKDDFHYPP